MKIKVIMLEPNKVAHVEEIEDSLESLQAAVGGGFIEPVYPFEDPVCIVCNEEGKINGMEFHRGLRDEDGRIIDILAGPCFICGLGEENFESVPEELIDKYTEMFDFPEMFMNFMGEIVGIKFDPVFEPEDGDESEDDSDC